MKHNRKFEVGVAESNLITARRLDNGEWVKGYYFCLHHNDDRTHIHHFVIPFDTPIPKDKPIGEIQVEIDPYSVRKNISEKQAQRQLGFNVKILSKDQCLEIAKIVMLDNLSEFDDLLMYLPDHVFGKNFEALEVNDGCVIIEDDNDKEWAVPFYFVEVSTKY